MPDGPDRNDIFVDFRRGYWGWRLKGGGYRRCSVRSPRVSSGRAKMLGLILRRLVQALCLLTWTDRSSTAGRPVASGGIAVLTPARPTVPLTGICREMSAAGIPAATSPNRVSVMSAY